MIDTTRLSSAAWASRISALPPGNRADVSSITRTPTLRGIAGFVVRLLISVAGVLLLAMASPPSRSTSAAVGTAPVSVIWLTSKMAITGSGLPSGSVAYVAATGGAVVGAIVVGASVVEARVVDVAAAVVGGGVVDAATGGAELAGPDATAESSAVSAVAAAGTTCSAGSSERTDWTTIRPRTSRATAPAMGAS